MANLVPVFKPGKTDTSSANNYRGISLTCILSKVLEKIVFNQLNDYLTQCGALSDNQYGFRRGRSCANLLLTTLDDWYLAQDAKKFTAIAFIDLSKAFDNVHHELLLLTLQKVGVNGTVLAWFYNYLNNRQQQIVTQESSSTPFLCSKGVPQGSVLGPLLFKAGPPLDLSFWSFLTFLHHGIEKVERHLLRKFYKKFEGKVGQMCHRSWSLA